MSGYHPRRLVHAVLLHASFAMLALVSILCQPGMAASAWRVYPSRTHITFTIDATGWPQTHGEFRNFDGQITLDFDHPAASRVRFTVQAASVDVGSKGLNDYVRSEVFFDAAKHPTMSFVSTKVEKRDARTAHVTGELTLLGVTKPIEIDVEVERKPAGARERVGFTAHALIHRSQFGMNSGVPLISDTVNLTVTTEAQAE